VNQEREKLIQQRLARFSSSHIQRETGRVVFIQNCSPCHQIKKEGGLIGPQLDGVGNWGAQLLATKILDPNRNISEAFRTYTIRLKDGTVSTGLYRREEGQVLVFANMAGEEFQRPAYLPAGPAVMGLLAFAGTITAWDSPGKVDTRGREPGYIPAIILKNVPEPGSYGNPAVLPIIPGRDFASYTPRVTNRQ